MSNSGIYVQVPFCQTKCTYCNFHTGVVASSRFRPYVEAVCREIREHRLLLEAAGANWPGRLRGGGVARETRSKDLAVDTVYIGGGTPSLLDPAHLQNILNAIRASFAADLTEVTLEADPETIEAGKAAAWVRAGINRVSFGLQSFSDKELVAAGRMHRRADIYRAVPISLEELAVLAPEHVSVYLLEIDEDSRLGKELLQGGEKYCARSVPSEDDMAEFYEMAQQALGAAGYHHYEISNWAKPGYESRHNLKYWRREPYLGFGAGAHSFLGTERWANAHDAAAYVTAVQGGRMPVEQHETLTAERALEEELFLGLRQLDGIDLAQIERDYGVSLAARFDPLTSAGLVERHGSIVRLAPERLSISNEVFVELMR